MAIEVKVHQTYEEMSLAVADALEREISKKPDIVLGLATGSTVLGLYQELIKRYKKGLISFKRAHSFNLDEYVGLSPDHKSSFHFAMKKNLFSGIDIRLENTHVPEGAADDLDSACAEYEARIEDLGGIDFQLLGIGSNGHIGFNEPGASCDSRTRIVDLDSQTIKDNSRFFANISQVPKKAITMGIGTILEAKKIVLVASGKQKAEAIKGAIDGDPIYPAACLNSHQDVVFYIDKDAASYLDAPNY